MVQAVISLRATYDPQSVEEKDLTRSLYKSIADFVGIGGLQNSDEDADVLSWELSVSVHPPCDGREERGSVRYRVLMRNHFGRRFVHTYCADDFGHAAMVADKDHPGEEIVAIDRIVLTGSTANT